MNFVNIIPIEETYLRVFEKPPKVRFTREIITFNYGNLSPYSGGGHLSAQTGTSIIVWYIKQPIPTGITIHLPEAYLVWNFFKDRINALIIISRNGHISVLVIKNCELCAQITRTTDVDDAEVLDLLKREYSLQNAEIIQLASTVRFKIALMDLITFADIKFKPTNLLENIVALVKAPLIAMLIITSGFYIYQELRLESYYAEKSAQLASLKRENADLHSSLEDLRGKTAYWQSFIAKERAYPNYYQVLSSLTEVVQRHGGRLNSVEFSDNRLTVGAAAKSSEASLIKDLLATGVFQEVKLLSSSKDSGKTDFHIYNLSIILRPLASEALSRVTS